MRISAADELGRLDATELAKRIGAGEVSAAESIESAITRLESVEGQLGATVPTASPRRAKTPQRCCTGRSPECHPDRQVQTPRVRTGIDD